MHITMTYQAIVIKDKLPEPDKDEEDMVSDRNQ